MSRKPILLIGGSGATGSKIARLLRQRDPGLPLVIGGRDLGKAQALAKELGDAEGVIIDLAQPSLGLGGRTDFSAVALVAYDPSLHAMNFAAGNGIPYVCLTGGAFEFAVDTIPGLRAARKAPVVLANNWFSGSLTMPALLLAERFGKVDAIDINIVIDRGATGEGGGPAAVADFERISTHCTSTLAREDGRYLWVTADKAKAKFKRADGEEMDGVGSVSADVLSIGAVTEAQSIHILEGWGVSASRAGGGPACDEIQIRMSGRGKDGAPLEIVQTIAGPRKPYPFTTISAVIILERLTGFAGGEPLAPGLYLAEHVVTPAFWIGRMKEEGVIFSEA